VVAVLNYTPHWPDELELCQGDVIHILHKDDELWWFGRLHNGEQGYFPSNHVTKQTQSRSRPQMSLLRLKGMCLAVSSPALSQLLHSEKSRLSPPQSTGITPRAGGLSHTSLDDKAQAYPLIMFFLFFSPAFVLFSRHCLKSPSCRKESLFLAVGPEASLPLTESVSHSSPSLLQKILLKHKKKGPYQGATNSAFEPD
ncbi:AHI1 protein, partial [Amia calva]|nr:AHI1 protein [Amia calva]